MGNYQSISFINFEQIQEYIQGDGDKCLIHTMNSTEQQCLIHKSLTDIQETSIINKYLSQSNKTQYIYIYGKNSTDKTVYIKFEQLKKLGFVNVYVYIGGLFEWLCLQDIYGKELFPTKGSELDILKYKPERSK